MKSPLVSVIMSIYNEKVEWIHESIDSILGQTFFDFEFIIVNDCPGRDDNVLMLEEYRKKDNRIIVVSNEKNSGLIKSLNKAINIAKGKYLARMDADDISLPCRFEKQVEIMEQNPNIIVCGSKFELFGIKREYKFVFPEKSEDIKNLLIKQCCFAHPTTMIRKSVLMEQNIRYDENALHAEDYKLWVDLYDAGDFYNIQDTLLLYRISNTQISNQNKKQQLHSALCRRKLIEKILKKQGCEDHFDWENIDVATLKKIKQYDIPDQMLETLYLSLGKYGIRAWFYFLCSLDYLHFTIHSNLAIGCRFFVKKDKLL
jgi:glycosyltransferase involved in cell wall biosynthesis